MPFIMTAKLYLFSSIYVIFRNNVRRQQFTPSFRSIGKENCIYITYSQWCSAPCSFGLYHIPEVEHGRQIQTGTACILDGRQCSSHQKAAVLKYAGIFYTLRFDNGVTSEQENPGSARIDTEQKERNEIEILYRIRTQLKKEYTKRCNKEFDFFLFDIAVAAYEEKSNYEYSCRDTHPVAQHRNTEQMGIHSLFPFPVGSDHICSNICVK